MVTHPVEVRLSVIVPCRNEARFLPNQLSALANQEYRGWWEVLVADNGSTDGTREVAESFAARLPGLRVVGAGQRRGRSWACNVGVEEAAGNAVVFVDADDEVAPGYLSAIAAALIDHPFVACRLDCEALNPEWVRPSRRSPQATGLQEWHLLPMALGGSLGMRRDVFLALGGFVKEMDYAEDVDLCWRAQLSGVPLTFAPDAVIRYRYRHTTPGV